MSTAPLDRAPLVIFGASGFVGTHLRRLLADWPGEVTLVTRSTIRAEAAERVVQGDLAAPGALAGDLPRGAVVINLAYDAAGGHDANLRLADGLATICASIGATRLVHVSTAMVVGLVDRFPVTEQTTCRPRTPYQRSKLEVEARLRERLADGPPVLVLRPTAVFGPGGLNLRKLVTDLTTRPPYENYLRACLFGSRPMNLVPVETVVASVLFAITAPAGGAVTWIVADDEVPENNFRDVEDAMRRVLEVRRLPLPVVPVPAAILTGVLKAAGRLSFEPRTTFSSAALTTAGFVRPVTFRDALRDYGEHARDHLRGGSAAAP